MADGRITVDTKVDEKGAKKGIQNLEKTVAGSATKMKKIGGQMTKYITAPLVALGGMAFAAADQMDKAYRNIQVGTGATGDALEDLKKSFKEVFEDVPDDADAVSNALATLNTYTGFTGETLENLTKKTLDASRMLEEDGVSASVAFGKALKSWNVPAEESEGHLEHLFRLTQDYDVGLGQLSDMITRHGTVLKNAGFEMDEVAHFMASMESKGIAVSRVMPGLNQATRKWAEEGKNAKEELGNVIDQMKNAETETEALALATEVFGAQGAQRMVDAVRNGAIPALDDLGSTMEGTSGLIEDTNEHTKTIGQEFGELKNNVTLALEPIGMIMIELAKEHLPPLIEAVQKVAEWFQNLSPEGQKLTLIILAIIAVLPPLIMLAGSLALAIMGISWPVVLVVAAIAVLIAIGVLLWKNWETIKTKGIEIWNSLKDWLIGLFENVKNVFSNALDWIDEKTGGKFKHVTDTIRDAMDTSLQIIKDIFKFIEDTFKNGMAFIKAVITGDFEEAKRIFKDQLQNISDFASGILEKIQGFFSRAWDRITDRVEEFKNAFLAVWEGIKNGIKAVINPIISMINNMIGGIESMVNAVAGGINTIPSFDIPSWVPKYGGGTFGLPDIPKISLPKIPSLDVGTNLVTRDGLAMIHAGEKIVPAEHTGPYKGGNDEIVIKPAPIYLNDREVGRAIFKVVDEEIKFDEAITNMFRGEPLR